MSTEPYAGPFKLASVRLNAGTCLLKQLIQEPQDRARDVVDKNSDPKSVKSVRRSMP